MAAKVKDIINARSFKDDGLPQKFRDVRDTTRGLTDELYTNAVIENLGTVPAWITGEGIEISEEPKIPTLSEIIKAAGLKDDAKDSKGYRSALDKFLEDFSDPKEREKMRKNIESDAKLGELGWETAKDLWKQATLDRMNADIDKNRADYLRGKGEGQGVGDWIGGLAMKFFTPRRYEAFARGEDPTWKDNLGDAIESGLMMVPATKYSNVFSKILGPARKILENKVAANVVGNSMAPILSEAMDDVMRGEDDPNTERQDFSLGDATMGLFTNLGVNKGLARLLGASGQIGTGELQSGSGSGMRRAAINMLENMGKSRKERGLGSALPEFIQNAKEKLPNNRVSSIIGGGLKGLDKSLDILGMGAPTLLVNRWGNDKDAKLGAVLFNMVGASGIDPFKTVEEIRDDERADMRNRKTAKEMEGIIKASDVLGLDSRDIGYIKAVQEDPSILTRGIAGPQGDDFKIWLLEKGHKLLRGTSAHRPLWTID